MEKNPEWDSGPAFLKTAVLDPSWAPQSLGFQLPSLFLPGSIFTHPRKVSHWSLCAGLYLSSPIFSFEPGPCVSPHDGSSDLKFSLTNKGKEPTSYWPQAARKGRFLLHTCGRLQEFEALRLFWASVRTWLGLRSHNLFSCWEQISCRPLTPLTLLAAAIKLTSGESWSFPSDMMTRISFSPQCSAVHVFLCQGVRCGVMNTASNTLNVLQHRKINYQHVHHLHLDYFDQLCFMHLFLRKNWFSDVHRLCF